MSFGMTASQLGTALKDQEVQIIARLKAQGCDQFEKTNCLLSFFKVTVESLNSAIYIRLQASSESDEAYFSFVEKVWNAFLANPFVSNIHQDPVLSKLCGE